MNPYGYQPRDTRTTRIPPTSGKSGVQPPETRRPDEAAIRSTLASLSEVAREINELTSALEDAIEHVQNLCPHTETKFILDGEDSHDRCLLCGKRL